MSFFLYPSDSYPRSRKICISAVNKHYCQVLSVNTANLENVLNVNCPLIRHYLHILNSRYYLCRISSLILKYVLQNTLTKI